MMRNIFENGNNFLFQLFLPAVVPLVRNMANLLNSLLNILSFPKKRQDTIIMIMTTTMVCRSPRDHTFACYTLSPSSCVQHDDTQEQFHQNISSLKFLIKFFYQQKHSLFRTTTFYLDVVGLREDQIFSLIIQVVGKEKGSPSHNIRCHFFIMITLLLCYYSENMLYIHSQMGGW